MKNDFVMVIPLFNEELRFNEAYFSELIQLSNTKWIFVNDGSTDNTAKILASLKSKHNIDILNLKSNYGKSEAIRKGFIRAYELFPHASWYGYLDSDGAFDISDIEKIMHIAIQNPQLMDAYFSSRVRLSGKKILRKTYRHFIGRLIVNFFRIFWKDIPYDTQSGYKLFKLDAHLLHSISTPFKTNWFIDIEIITRISISRKILIQIWEEPVSKWSDVDGSKIRLKNIFQISLEILFIQYTLFRNRNLFVS